MRSIAVAASLVALTFSLPASATITFGTAQGAIQGTNVLYPVDTNADNDVTTVFGTVGNTSDQVLFKSLTGQTLLTPSTGAARVEAQGAALSSISFELVDPSKVFDFAEFNLFGGPGTTATSVTLTGFDGATLFSDNFDIGNGENFFTLTTDAAQTIKRVTFSTLSGGVTDLRQVRIGTVSTVTAVPEPSTWAMMLLGFGAIGFGMRRRKAATPRVKFNFA